MQRPKDTQTDDPPIFNSWRPLYAVVIGVLLVQIIIFYAITRYFE